MRSTSLSTPAVLLGLLTMTFVPLAGADDAGGTAAPRCAGRPGLRICAALTRPPAGAIFPRGRGRFEAGGWRLQTEDDQLVIDLGSLQPRGTVELEIAGPVAQPDKRILLAAWPDAAAEENVTRKETARDAAFFQVRLQERGMMLRLTHRPGGHSFEGLSPALPWKDAGFHHIKATWNTAGGDSVLWLDGKELQRGRFKGSFAGFRYLFLGRDNYRPDMARAIPGLVIRNLQVYGMTGPTPAATGRAPRRARR
jgi:hypothetical protein